MAIALVTAASAYADNVSKSVTSGNLLVFVASGSGDHVNAPVSSGVTTSAWTQVDAASDGGVKARMFWATATQTGTLTVTISNYADTGCSLHEYSGQHATPLGVHGNNNEAASGDPNDAPVALTGVTAGSAIVGIYADELATATVTADSPYIRQTYESTHLHGTADEIVVGAGNYTPNWSMSGDIGAWAAIAAEFKAAAGGTTESRTATSITAALKGTIARTATAVKAALGWTRTRTVASVTAAITSRLTRTITAVTAAILRTSARTVASVTTALRATRARTVASVTATIRQTYARTTTAVTAAILRTTSRTAQSIMAAVLWTTSRTATAITAALAGTITRTVASVTAVLSQAGASARTVTGVTVALIRQGLARTVASVTSSLASRIGRPEADVSAGNWRASPLYDKVDEP